MKEELLKNFVPVVVMTQQEEQQLAQKWVDMFNAQEGFEPIDRLALAKHLENVAKLASNMLTHNALNQVTQFINDKVPCEKKGEPIQVNKQFTYHGNKWMYQIKETYGQLGNQRLPDGTFDANSATYHTLEVQQEQMKKDSKALTAQMAGLKARILADHPKLQPTEIIVSLALKGQE